ncbi:capping protein inhibiting regulator of actin dynamics isoform X2 [Ornithorhynchus anatinus]|uniref:capping protein inhibiting regulator of actin dynamics isoform X2 n=1 Tax=Ornithorhynchus anatinus TaxID=9258 RepID=UPI0019D49A74|nr:capping protein inhibiting regulator of actin dynamics isoform X2 [Ornithorhynchus anatinus]
MGGRAFSHDSIFLPEGPAESQAGTLQQPGQDLVPGQCPPSTTTGAGGEPGGLRGSLEETEAGPTLGLPDRDDREGAPGSPALGEESSFPGRAEAAGEWEPDLRSLPETCSWDASRSLLFLSSGVWSRDVPDPPTPAPGPASTMEDKVPPVRPSRPKRHFSTAGTIESVNLDAIPLALTHLDNSAAKHRLSVKPRNQRVSKKHHRLGRDPQSQRGSLETQLETQNGHCAGEMPTWSGEVRERQGEEHGKRSQAEGRGHEAEAAEKKRLEEQSLWRLDSQSEEMEEEEQQETSRRSLLGDKRKQSLPEGGRGEEMEEQWSELEVKECQEGERQKLEGQTHREEEGQRLEEERRRLEEEERRKLEEEERQRRRDEERQRLEEEERQKLEEEERQRRRDEERQRLEEEERRRRRDEERQRLEEEERRRRRDEERQRLEEEERRRRRDEERQRLEEEERRRRRDEERQRLEEEERRRRRDEERQRLEEEERRRRRDEERQRLEEEERRRRRDEERQRLEEERQRQEEQRCQEEERRKLEEEERRRLEEEQRQELASLELEGQQLPAEVAKPLRELKRQETPAETPKRPEAEKQEEEEGGAEWRLEGRRRPLDGEDGKRLGTKGNPPQEGPGKKRQGGDAAGGQNLRGQAKLEPPGDGESERDPGSRGGRGGDVGRPGESAPPQPKGAGAQERDHGGEEEELRWREVDERQSTPRPYTFQVSSGGRQILFPKVNLSPVAPPPPPPSGHEPPGAHPLPASLGIPHTAILVTGTQLCGPAVDLSQIKDSACRSLLGRSEERRSASREAPARRAGDGKARDGPESARNEAALAEWASIRSKILKNANWAGWSPAVWGGPRGSINKTQPVAPKFSITPAWQKFPDPARPGGGADDTGREARVEGSGPKPGPADGPARPPGGPAGDADGCKFAKDLPSFLVPGLPPSPPRGPPPDGTGEAEAPPPGADDGLPPFGIKLRRTNYSLRFQYDQQAEQKKKKRLSGSGPGAGSGGTPTPPVPADGETDAEAAPAAAGPRKDPSGRLPAPVGLRWPPPQRPALAPKPAHRTPPPSPLSRGSGAFWAGPPAPRAARPGAESEDRGPRSPRDRPGAGEEGATGKASLLGPETIKKEKPGLQTRHSLDASGRTDEGHAALPTWINVALEKQRGFREQQASREERRKQVREAKQPGRRPGQQAGAREEPEGGSAGGSQDRATAPEKRKADETVVTGLQRRELLQKSNTLPTSLTVEISDSVPPAPLLKEVAKRFSTPDAAPVATEPAWLALAKRKAKAWSDCPQIIK